MTKQQMSELHKLSKKDKIKIVQALWNDIASDQSIDTLPTEHKKILDERIQKMNTGYAVFKPWIEVQNKYRTL